jgi:hypothetical protein
VHKGQALKQPALLSPVFFPLPNLPGRFLCSFAEACQHTIGPFDATCAKTALHSGRLLLLAERVNWRALPNWMQIGLGLNNRRRSQCEISRRDAEGETETLQILHGV